ncbi:MAG: Daunorubicin resistance ABC transporter ATPase subunit, partial [Candidatus Gottesmanbacteria bacterium GW2011_GWC2_39_8]
SDLSKKFNGLAAVDNANFTVKEGEVLAFLGPNGAGKTTTISMLATILEPTSGTAEINGFDIIKNKSDVRKSIGVIFQDPSLDDELTACENLIFHGVMYDIKKELMEDRISELLKLVDLLERKDDLVIQPIMN